MRSGTLYIFAVVIVFITHCFPRDEVLLSKYSEATEDGVMRSFLDFLSQDVANNPQTLKKLDLSRGYELVDGIDVNLDDEISDED